MSLFICMYMRILLYVFILFRGLIKIIVGKHPLV